MYSRAQYVLHGHMELEGIVTVVALGTLPP